MCPQVEVSPLENAIQVVENKNQELRALISQYQHKQVHGNINLLSMCLNGVIDAAVNGGIARYQEVSWGLRLNPGWESSSQAPLLEIPASEGSLLNKPSPGCTSADQGWSWDEALSSLPLPVSIVPPL